VIFPIFVCLFFSISSHQVLILSDSSLQGVSMDEDAAAVKGLLKERKLDAVVAVAGGWAGGHIGCIPPPPSNSSSLEIYLRCFRFCLLVLFVKSLNIDFLFL